MYIVCEPKACEGEVEGEFVSGVGWGGDGSCRGGVGHVEVGWGGVVM